MNIINLKSKLIPRHYRGTGENGVKILQSRSNDTNNNYNDSRNSLINLLEDKKKASIGSSFRQNARSNQVLNGRQIKDNRYLSDGFMYHPEPGDTLWNYQMQYFNDLNGSDIDTQEDYTVEVNNGKYQYVKKLNGLIIDSGENLQRNQIPEQIRGIMQPTYDYDYLRKTKWTTPFYPNIENQ